MIQVPYRIYLLTIWSEPDTQSPEGTIRRYRLEDPRSGQWQGFATEEALVAVLKSGFASSEEEKAGGDG